MRLGALSTVLLAALPRVCHLEYVVTADGVIPSGLVASHRLVRQTMNHIVDTCPLTKFEGGLNLLHKADDDAVIWLESTATAALAKWNVLSSANYDSDVLLSRDIWSALPAVCCVVARTLPHRQQLPRRQAASCMTSITAASVHPRWQCWSTASHHAATTSDESTATVAMSWFCISVHRQGVVLWRRWQWHTTTAAVSWSRDWQQWRRWRRQCTAVHLNINFVTARLRKMSLWGTFFQDSYFPENAHKPFS